MRDRRVFPNVVYSPANLGMGTTAPACSPKLLAGAVGRAKSRPPGGRPIGNPTDLLEQKALAALREAAGP